MVTKIWPIRMFFVTFHSLAVSKLFSFWILNCVITSGRTYESVGAPSPRVRRGQRRHSGRARPLEGRREHDDSSSGAGSWEERPGLLQARADGARRGALSGGGVRHMLMQISPLGDL